MNNQWHNVPLTIFLLQIDPLLIYMEGVSGAPSLPWGHPFPQQTPNICQALCLHTFGMAQMEGKG